MSRSTGKTYGSCFWESPRLIDAYCEERANMLLNYMDVIFEDLSNAVDDDVQLVSAMPAQVVDAHRLAMHKCDLLMRLGGLQLDTLRRVVDDKQENQQTFLDNRNKHLTEINDRLASKPLPCLPVEIVTQIFSFVYFLERGDDKSTVKQFLHDADTPDVWRNVVRREILDVVARGTVVDTQVSRYYAHEKREIAEMAGLHPMVFSSDEEIPTPGQPATILISLKEWSRSADVFCKKFPGITSYCLDLERKVVKKGRQL